MAVVMSWVCRPASISHGGSGLGRHPAARAVSAARLHGVHTARKLSQPMTVRRTANSISRSAGSPAQSMEL